MSDSVFDALLNNINLFEKDNNVNFDGNGKLITDITSITLHMIQEKNCGPEWGGYLAIDNDTRIIIGTCAFKGAPTTEGEVEIAFFTFPKFEGQGYGTAMVKKLIAVATQKESVKLIVANSLPQQNASTRILEKCGWINKGEEHTEEDGLVWRWEYLINR
jgi:RimJ/RimL family protein N-acetyltransferase